MMKKAVVSFLPGFKIILNDNHSQAATMVLAPGGQEGGPGNRHRGADQWLFVISGTGEAQVAGETFALQPHSLILVQRGEEHGFRNTGSQELRILTFYVPPAYDSNEEELPAGQA